MTTAPKIPCGLAEVDKIAKLTRDGWQMREIAPVLGWKTSHVNNVIHRVGGLYRLWLESKPARHARNKMCAREREESRLRAIPRKSDEDAGGPVSPSLKALATLAAAARRKREEDAETMRKDALESLNLFIGACMRHADGESRVCVSEVAEALGWQPQFAYRMARRAVDAGQFPYRFKAREVVETGDESDIPWLDLAAVYGAARTIREDGVRIDRSSERGGTLTPALPHIVNPASDDYRTAIDRYRREWKQARKAKPLAAEREKSRQEVA